MADAPWGSRRRDRRLSVAADVAMSERWSGSAAGSTPIGSVTKALTSMTAELRGGSWSAFRGQNRPAASKVTRHRMIVKFRMAAPGWYGLIRPQDTANSHSVKAPFSPECAGPLRHCHHTRLIAGQSHGKGNGPAVSTAGLRHGWFHATANPDRHAAARADIGRFRDQRVDYR